MKVYTKTGDKGETSLISKRVSKSHARINLIGKVDEVMVLMGKLISSINKKDITLRDEIKKIYRVYFMIQGIIADEDNHFKMSINQDDIGYLEDNIDKMNEKLTALKNFIYYIGVESSMFSHEVRVNIRAAERLAVAIHEEEPLDEMVLQYLNRSSDYFYTLGRYFNYINNIKEEIIKL